MLGTTLGINLLDRDSVDTAMVLWLSFITQIIRYYMYELNCFIACYPRMVFSSVSAWVSIGRVVNSKAGLDEIFQFLADCFQFLLDTGNTFLSDDVS